MWIANHTNRHSKCSRLGRKPFVYLGVRLATSCGPATSDAETFEGTFKHDHSVTKVLRISPSCMFHEPADGRRSCHSSASSVARLSRPLHEVQTKDARRTSRAKETYASGACRCGASDREAQSRYSEQLRKISTADPRAA